MLTPPASPESPLVRQSDSVKRDRKVLLSELSGLVNLTRREAANLAVAGPDLDSRAGRILVRAGRFTHTIGPLSGLYLEEAAKLHSVEVTPTPPVSYDFSTPTIAEEDEEQESETQRRILSTEHEGADLGTTSALRQLEATHEDLLSQLAAFIGRLHLQSQTQTANHILLATRQCVNAARALLATLEAIYNCHSDLTLARLRDQLYTEITNLVTRAREVVETQNGVISDTRPLITAATGIVRGAGQCTSRARYLIETIGDITLQSNETGDEDVTANMSRDDTSSSLASLIEQRSSRDVQKQVEQLAIPYKKIHPAEPRQEQIPAVDKVDNVVDEIEQHLTLAPAESTRYAEEDDELSFNMDKQVTGGTLSALVARLTPPDCMAEPVFYSAFFLTFRSFADPVDIADLLISRFDWSLACRDNDATWDVTHGKPIRLRVYNVLKNWLEVHWRPDED
ncbi:protein of unknown function, partial [Taphrina deformans PYCC 5710]